MGGVWVRVRVRLSAVTVAYATPSCVKMRCRYCAC